MIIHIRFDLNQILFRFIPAKVTKSAPSLVYYVVPVAIALSVLLLVVLILLVYLKQRRKGDPADATAAQANNENTVVVGTARVSKQDIGSPRVPGPLDKVSSIRGMISVAFELIPCVIGCNGLFTGADRFSSLGGDLM